MPDRSYLPYYYGLNYDAPAEPEVPVQPLGAMLGSVYRQGAIGVDSGLWYQKLTGMPLDAFQIPLNTNTVDEGTISQGSWLDFNPTIKSAYEGLQEMLGISPSGRVVDRLRRLKSPLLRPQGAFEAADYAAGLVADVAQTGLAAADLAAIAGPASQAARHMLANQRGQVDVWHGSPHRFDRVSHE